MSHDPVRTVAGVLEGFDLGFSEFAASFTAGDYVLWLGSGISRDVVPNVQQLLVRVLEMLRANIDHTNLGCPYLAAIKEALALAGLSHGEVDAIDLTVPVASWADRDSIAWRLTSRYAELLDIPVAGQPADYLVWSGLNVTGTYGDPSLEPDVEHLCIALLALEGVVSSVVTANWDGLIERAFAVLTNEPDAIIRVIVRGEDFRQSSRRTELIKFHGCAVRARSNEATYRTLLVARQQQISGWTERKENGVMRKHLELLYTDNPSLVVGLSVQDANMHTIIARAIEDLPRPWPHMPPAVVLAEERLQAHHRHVLQMTYGSAKYETQAAEITDSAVLGSFAKPTLLGLLLWTLTDKLLAVLSYLPVNSSWSETETKRLRFDLLSVRDTVAAGAEPDNRAFLSQLLDLSIMVLGIFRTGRAPASGAATWEPLSDRPIRDALLNPDFPAAAFGCLAVAISLLGRGHFAGDWTLLPGATSAPTEGALRLAPSGSSTRREVRVFLVKDTAAAITLTVGGLADEDDPTTLIVLAEREPTAVVRSPRPRYGRVGSTGAARVSIEDLYATAESADNLYAAFKLAGGIS